MRWSSHLAIAAAGASGEEIHWTARFLVLGGIRRSERDALLRCYDGWRGERGRLSQMDMTLRAVSEDWRDEEEALRISVEDNFSKFASDAMGRGNHWLVL